MSLKITPKQNNNKVINLHLTNITGLGATQLLQSLLPNFEQLTHYQLNEIYLPSQGELAYYKTLNKETKLNYYKRYLPNSISRLLECTLLSRKFDSTTPLLVLGDLPLRSHAKQTVFVQTTLLTSGAVTDWHIRTIKYWIARSLFQLNIKYVSSFIVQTETMKAALIKTFPKIKGRVHIVAQPVPNWLLDSQLKRTQRNSQINSPLQLFYPAANYPHKNHLLLKTIQANQQNLWPISKLSLTIPEKLNPNPEISWIYCTDRLMPDAVIKAYKTTDALLFLSLSESFGFPLLEAMWIGLPIICPKLPYAQALCGNQAIYFNPENVNSLQDAIVVLKTRLDSGWWPDWSKTLKDIPNNWNDVANAMSFIATSERDVD